MSVALVDLHKVFHAYAVKLSAVVEEECRECSVEVGDAVEVALLYVQRAETNAAVNVASVNLVGSSIVGKVESGVRHRLLREQFPRVGVVHAQQHLVCIDRVVLAVGIRATALCG